MLLTLANVRWRPVVQDQPPWFQQAFPAIFWFSTLSFALVHASNYDEPYQWMILPALLPQLAGGIVLGFARLRHGLWASILLHGGFNCVWLLGYVLFER